MLFKQIHLEGIKSGKIRFAFRRWEKAAVKKGSLLKTSIGLLKIVDIKEIGESKITGKDILQTGFNSREQLIKSLNQTNNGSIYKIEIRYHSTDPRIELREQKDLTTDNFSELQKKLERFDRYSKQGFWTEKILLAIKDNPHKKATELALLTGYEKKWLKLNIRKLKNLGLTISHIVGYELSPLGKVFMNKLKK